MSTESGDQAKAPVPPEMPKEAELELQPPTPTPAKGSPAVPVAGQRPPGTPAASKAAPVGSEDLKLSPQPAAASAAAPAAAVRVTPLDRGWPYTPHLIVFLASVGIMAIELVAGRLIGRHLGSSLYTWTAIIGVIMAGMSVGNYVGGRMADRWRPERLLAWLLLLSAAACVLTLGLNVFFAEHPLFRGFSWPLRIFLTVLCIFSLPAMVLGTITPVTVKLALERSRAVGATIGSIYAWGTVGSILGTMATGFFLVAMVGAVNLILCTAAGLVLTAVGLQFLRLRPALVPGVLAGVALSAALFILHCLSPERDALAVPVLLFVIPAVALIAAVVLEAWLGLGALPVPPPGTVRPGTAAAYVRGLQRDGPAAAYWAWAPHAIMFCTAGLAAIMQFLAARLMVPWMEGTPTATALPGVASFHWAVVTAFAVGAMVVGHTVGRVLARTSRSAGWCALLFIVCSAFCALALRKGWLAPTGEDPEQLRRAMLFGFGFLALPGLLLGFFPPLAAGIERDRVGEAERSFGGIPAWGAAGWLAGLLVLHFLLLPGFSADKLLWEATLGLGLIAAWVAFLVVPRPLTPAWLLLVAAAVVQVLIAPDPTQTVPAGKPAETFLGLEIGSLKQLLVFFGPGLLMGLFGLWKWFCFAGVESDEDAREEAHPAWQRLRVPRETGWRYTPHLLVFCSAACLMAMEIVAGRLIGRHLGSSIYTWTSIIGVVLAGMTVGYYIGGRLSDRWLPERFLGWIYLLASFFCLTTILVNHYLAAESPLAKYMSWPYRVFFSTLSVFLLPSMALGMISPAVAKMALNRSTTVGATIGAVYAWGTLGSIAGTLATGFYLISALGAPGLVMCVALGLAVIACLIGPQRALTAAWVVLVAFVILLSRTDRGKDTLAGFGKDAEAQDWSQLAYAATVKLGLRESDRLPMAQDSDYQFVKVYEKGDDEHSVRVLSLDYLIHAYVDLNEPRHLKYDYELVYRDVAKRYATGKPSVTAFFMGGGGYTFPRWLLTEWPDAKMDVAEIDPLVVVANEKALGLKGPPVHALVPDFAGPPLTSIRTVVGDARNTVDSLPADKKYDFFFGDAFNDLSVPWHLTTLEYTQKVRDHLNPTGAYLANIIDDYRFGKFIGATYVTMKQVFPYVYVFCTSEEGVADRRDTFVVAASLVPIRITDWLPGPEHDPEFTGSALTDANLAELERKCKGLVLTDDFAPVENLLQPVVQTRK